MRATVAADTPRQRLDRYLAELLPESSRAQIQRLIKEGHIRVDGETVKPSHHVLPGEKLTIEIPPVKPMDLKPERIPFSILYEDKHLLVVEKPAGLVVHPAVGHAGGTLVNALLAHGGPYSAVAGPFKPGIVHRLDKETSGIMVVAKDDKTHRHLAEQFSQRKVKRMYLALVRGVIQRDEGTINAPIGRHPIRRKEMAVLGTVHQQRGASPGELSPRVREAITRYRVMKRFPRATLVALFPETGRTHQLRVHLAHIGHPILGDVRYGVKASLDRQALHAHKLGFFHPLKGRWVEFISPLPEDFSCAMKMLASQKNP